MELTLPFYERGELRTEPLRAAPTTAFLECLQSDAICHLTRGGITGASVWDYHFVKNSELLEDPSMILEALNLLEGRIYRNEQNDQAALFLPSQQLSHGARASLVRQLQNGAQLQLTVARACLHLSPTQILITTCRVSELTGELEL